MRFSLYLAAALLVAVQAVDLGASSTGPTVTDNRDHSSDMWKQNAAGYWYKDEGTDLGVEPSESKDAYEKSLVKRRIAENNARIEAAAEEQAIADKQWAKMK